MLDKYHWEVVAVRGSFAAPALLEVPISALQDTLVPVEELVTGQARMLGAWWKDGSDCIVCTGLEAVEVRCFYLQSKWC